MPSLFRRFLTRKLIIRSAFCGFTLIALLAVAYAVEKWRGQRAWEAYTQTAGQRGVKLWAEEFVQPEIPNDKNYAAQWFFREIVRADKKKRLPKKVGLPNMANAYHLEAFRFEIKSTRTSMLEVRDFFVANKELPQPTAQPLQDVERFLMMRTRALQDLRSATDLPHSRFPTLWGRGTGTERMLVMFLKDCVVLFRISSNTQLALGRVGPAAKEIRHLLRLSEAIRAEPGLMSGIIGAQSLDYIASAISEGLISRQWNDLQLERFETRLASLNPVADLRFALSSERAFVNSEYERIAQKGFKSPYPNAKVSRLVKLGALVYPAGWVRQNMVKTNEFYDYLVQQLEPAAGEHREGFHPKLDHDDWSQRNFGKSALSRTYWAFARSTVYLTQDSESPWIYAHSHIAQTRLACALERYSRAHGKFPEKLTALVPEFLPALPESLAEGSQIYYQAEGEDGYVLWETSAKSSPDGAVDTSEKGLTGAKWVWRISPRVRPN